MIEQPLPGWEAARRRENGPGTHRDCGDGIRATSTSWRAGACAVAGDDKKELAPDVPVLL